MKQLHEKLPEDELPLETPRGQNPDIQVPMIKIFRDAKTADDFAEVNKGRERRERKPAIYQRDNTISRRETFAASYVDTNLKYEIRASFELTNSDFYELSQQELHRCLSR